MLFSCGCWSEKEVGEDACFVKRTSLPAIHGASLGLGRPGVAFLLTDLGFAHTKGANRERRVAFQKDWLLRPCTARKLPGAPQQAVHHSTNQRRSCECDGSASRPEAYQAAPDKRTIGMWATPVPDNFRTNARR